MVGPWVTEQLGQGYLCRQLGGHPGRGGPLHPAPPHAVGDLRRDDARPHRKRSPRWLTSPCPSLGETVTEGTITRWLKQVGDEVAEDEVLFEVSTDKVDSEVPSPVSGVPHRDPRSGGGHRRRRHPAGRDLRRGAVRRRPRRPPPRPRRPSPRPAPALRAGRGRPSRRRRSAEAAARPPQVAPAAQAEARCQPGARAGRRLTSRTGAGGRGGTPPRPAPLERP